jgi:hypothetical protein
MRAMRNPLGQLRWVEGVESVHYAKAGTLVNFTDGTKVRLPNQTAYGLREEANRLERRAAVMRAVAANIGADLDV